MSNFIRLGKNTIVGENPMGMHSHSHWELTVCLEGNGVETTEHGDVLFEEGTVIIHPPQRKHANRSIGYSYTCIAIHFIDYPYSNTMSVYKDAGHNPISNLAGIIFKEYIFKQGNWQSRCDVLLSVLIDCINTYNLKISPNRYVEAVKNLFADNISDPYLNLEQTAESIGISKMHLYRLFMQYLECSPMHYLMRLRIDKAVDLLYMTDMTIREIAKRVGIVDACYFSRIFKKFMSFSPLEYRQKHHR